MKKIIGYTIRTILIAAFILCPLIIAVSTEGWDKGFAAAMDFYKIFGSGTLAAATIIGLCILSDKLINDSKGDDNSFLE